MGRSTAAAAALAAVAVVCGCTVQGADGKGHSPVHITLPSSAARSPSSPAADKPSATPSTKSGPAVLWSPGDTGGGVRELQARLRQVDWLFDGPTGTYDDLTQKAVKGFQGKRGLRR